MDPWYSARSSRSRSRCRTSRCWVSDPSSGPWSAAWASRCCSSATGGGVCRPSRSKRRGRVGERRRPIELGTTDPTGSAPRLVTFRSLVRSGSPARSPPDARVRTVVDLESVLDGLNPAQREAALALRGPVAILAGAGTGKTTTITHRIACQVRGGAFDASQILAVTFPDKAAGELRSRLAPH